MADGLMTIGVFSRASLLSVKALRAYHEAGILVPAVVDPRTGYRSYGVDQLGDAAVVSRLRRLDVPLAAIKRIMDARDPEVTRRELAAHEEVMRERLVEAQQIVTDLQTGRERPTVHTPVHVRDEPHRYALGIRGRAEPEDFGTFLGEAYAQLGAAFYRSGAQPAGPAGALYPPETPDGIGEVVAFLPIAAPVPVAAHGAVELIEIPARRVAVLVHAGGYDDVDVTYGVLGAWVVEHAEPDLEAWIRELYLVSPGESSDPGDFRTEICWPLAEPKERA
ncbi:MAG: MerR family transcriptional regulator [Actinomycetota bacterium]